MNRLSSRLAARTSTRQLDLLHAANAAGYAADALVRQQWQQLIDLLAHPDCRRLNCPALALRLRVMFLSVANHLRDSLRAFAYQGHESSASILTDILPQRALLQARPGRPTQPVRAFPEGQANGAPGGAHTLFVQAHTLFVRLDEAKAPHQPSAERRTSVPQTLSAPGKPPPRRPREPVVGGSDDEKRREELRRILFPAPSEAKVADILRRPVFGQTWDQDLTTASKLAGFDPEKMAVTIAQRFAFGDTPQQIAKQLMPAVDGVKKTARRIARTYGMQVSHAVSREAHEQLGDLLVGYQAHSQLDQNTRSWHAARSGTIYYKNPAGDQKGYAQMPNPPLEADDANERPAGEPKLANH